jgi:hypothetical protein
VFLVLLELELLQKLLSSYLYFIHLTNVCELNIFVFAKAQALLSPLVLTHIAFLLYKFYYCPRIPSVLRKYVSIFFQTIEGVVLADISFFALRY